MASKRKSSIDYRDYWEQRLVRHTNLRGTGHRAFSLAYNKILYQAQRDCVEMMIDRHKIEISGQRVLDVGSGTGFYVAFFREKGASQVVGLDYTEASVEYLRTTYPDGEFHVCDIGGERLPVSGPFGVISAISVLYHLVDDAQYDRAIANLCLSMADGGAMLISDTFCTRSLTAAHARFRPLDRYERLLRAYGVEVVDLLPLYYLLNRTFMPILAPRVLGLKWVSWALYETDKRWRAEGRDNGGSMKLMLACKTSAGSTNGREGYAHPD